MGINKDLKSPPSSPTKKSMQRPTIMKIPMLALITPKVSLMIQIMDIRILGV